MTAKEKQMYTEKQLNIEESHVLDLDQLNSFVIPLDKLFSLQVNCNNVKYEFLIRFSSTNKNLICFGSGAYDPKKFSPPVYQRHSWHDGFEESLIYYNDPTLYVDPALKIGWGIGRKDEEWYMAVISYIIRTLTSKQGIESRNILFFGSSGGGFTSVILATLIRDSTAMVNNPQMFLKDWIQHVYDTVTATCLDDLDPETINAEYCHRLDVIELFKKENYVPKITYLINITSEIDYYQQFIPFMDGLNSLESKVRITVVLYQHERGHNGLLDKKETIKLIKDHFKMNDEIMITNVSIIENQNQLLIVKNYEIEMNKLKDQLFYYQQKVVSLEENSTNMEKQLEIIANTKPYRIAYALRRFSHEFLKGNIDHKKNFLKWTYCKLIKKDSGLEFKYNPILKLVKK